MQKEPVFLIMIGPKMGLDPIGPKIGPGSFLATSKTEIEPLRRGQITFALAPNLGPFGYRAFRLSQSRWAVCNGLVFQLERGASPRPQLHWQVS